MTPDLRSYLEIGNVQWVMNMLIYYVSYVISSLLIVVGKDFQRLNSIHFRDLTVEK